MPLPKSVTTVTPLSKTIALLLFVILPFLGFFLGMSYQRQLQKPEQEAKQIYLQPTSQLPSLSPVTHSKSGAISDAEKAQIDLWIKQNNLNQYGDPKDLMYAGGTPLYNERTGKTQDRYEYILFHHPTRPWSK